MNCDEARQIWHDRLDGESDPLTEAKMAAHMSACSSCRVWREQMERMCGVLDELREESDRVVRDPSRDRDNPSRDREGAVAPKRLRTRRSQWWTIGRIAAAIALMVGGGVYVFNHGAHDSTKATSVVNPIDPPVALAARSSATLALTGTSADKYISVRHETSVPNVHIFRLYRAYKRPEAETSDS